MAKQKKYAWRANGITLFRVLLSVPLWYALVTPGWEWTAVALVAVIGVLDSADGQLARRVFHEVSSFGGMFDQIADKIFLVAALFPLVYVDKVPGWIAALFITREFLVSGVRMILASYTETEIKERYAVKVLKRCSPWLGMLLDKYAKSGKDAGIGGKLKTILQFISIGCIASDTAPYTSIGEYTLLVTLVLSYVFLYTYTTKNDHGKKLLLSLQIKE